MYQSGHFNGTLGEEIYLLTVDSLGCADTDENILESITSG
jgi:hypothetical protein